MGCQSGQDVRGIITVCNLSPFLPSLLYTKHCVEDCSACNRFTNITCQRKPAHFDRHIGWSDKCLLFQILVFWRLKFYLLIQVSCLQGAVLGMEWDPKCKSRIPTSRNSQYLLYLKLAIEYKLMTVLKVLAFSFTTLQRAL